MDPGRTIFRDVEVIDGTGAAAFRAHVVVQGNRIAAVARGAHPAAQGAIA
jgi:N-acyl-D-aspartate/D-glutamate deacylase